MQSTIRNLILVVLLSLTAIGAHAASVSTTGLTAEEQARIEAQIATMKAERLAQQGESAATVITEVSQNPERLGEYAEIGKAVASSIGAAAKELGIAVNDFMQTGTGTMVMFLVVYHFFGAEILRFLVGYFFVIPLTLYGMRYFVKKIKLERYEYDDKGKRREILNANLSKSESESVVWVYVIGMIATLIEIFVFLP